MKAKKLRGCLKGGDGWRGSVTVHIPLWSDLPNFHSTVNWHGVRYQNTDSENIHVGERQIMEDGPRATVCLGWGGKTPHRQNFTFHTRVSQPHLISLPPVCGVSPLSNRPPKRKLAVKYDIIKSSGFFDYEESMNYSEATDGNISLHLAASMPVSFFSLTAALFSFFSIYQFFCLICSLPLPLSLISILWDEWHYC